MRVLQKIVLFYQWRYLFLWLMSAFFLHPSLPHLTHIWVVHMVMFVPSYLILLINSYMIWTTKHNSLSFLHAVYVF